MAGSPYTDSAATYLQHGWNPIPLPYKRKAPPPDGFTGYTGWWVTPEHVAGWASGKRNVGLRLTENVIGIDVDAYDGKPGADTLTEAEQRLGPLPHTWRSSARSLDAVSGIRFFRVPPDRAWADRVGPGVEVIHHGHRYAVAAPSVHPDTGLVYTWWDEIGLPCDYIPPVAELPALPYEWVQDLDRGSAGERSAKADMSGKEVTAWLGDLPPGPACERLVHESEVPLPPGSRHDPAAQAILRILRFGEAGHKGAADVLAALQERFLAAVEDQASRPAASEWRRMVAGAVRIVVEQPTPDAERGCCEPDFTPLDDTFWTLSDDLVLIRAAARARRISPDGLLAMVLIRILLEVPPQTKLPPVVGAAAPLNLGVALVGTSGDGKSSIISASAELLGLTGLYQEQDAECTVGSGEGMVQAFLRWDDETKSNVLAPDPRKLFLADEVEQLGALKARTGSTVMPVLRSGLTGGSLGQQNAEKARRRHVPRGTYRMCFAVGVQPTKSGILLEDADAGTPQRLVWVSVVDRDAPDDPPNWPGGLAWDLPDGLNGVFDYPDYIKQEIDALQVAKLRGEAKDPLAGHRMLTRLKLMAALALLHGETKGSDRWWEAAGQLVAASSRVQRACQRVLVAETERTNVYQAQLAGRARDVADVSAAEVRHERITKNILKWLPDDWAGWSGVRKKLNAPDRADADDLLAVLADGGRLDLDERDEGRFVRKLVQGNTPKAG